MKTPLQIQFHLDAKTLKGWAERVRREAPEVFNELLDECGAYMAETMRSKAPVRTGFLRDSIKIRKGRDSVTVAPTAPYAAYVEYGTKPHIIEPVRASVLAFEIGGETVFAKRVMHPGFQGAHFVRDTKAECLPRIRQLFLDYAKLLFGGD